jgi:hypothetical protein
LSKIIFLSVYSFSVNSCCHSMKLLSRDLSFLYVDNDDTDNNRGYNSGNSNQLTPIIWLVPLQSFYSPSFYSVLCESIISFNTDSPAFCISSWLRSCLCVAIDQLCPKGSFTCPYLSPQNMSMTGITTVAPASTA